VQYGGLSHGLRRGPVEEVSLSEFAQGCSISVRMEDSSWFDRNEVVRRARLRLGENRYHVLTNNCEHFCEWCVRREHRSYQVDKLIARYSQAREKLTGLFARVLCATATLLKSVTGPPAAAASFPATTVPALRSVINAITPTRTAPAAPPSISPAWARFAR
jgi:hypothetical protein